MMCALELVWANELLFNPKLSNKTKLAAAMLGVLGIVIVMVLSLNGILPSWGESKEHYSGIITFCIFGLCLNLGLFFRILKDL